MPLDNSLSSTETNGNHGVTVPAAIIVLPLESLLCTIPGDNPAGANLKDSKIYHQITEARRQDESVEFADARPLEKKKVANYSAVIRIAEDALANHTKDLQLVNWLVEALIIEKGSAGLRDGLLLCRRLLEDYWPGLYPTDIELRAGRIEQLNFLLPPCIHAIPLTNSQDGEKYTWQDWFQSTRDDPPEGVIRPEEFEQAVATTPDTHYVQLQADLEQSAENSRLLSAVVEQKYETVPGLSRDEIPCLDPIKNAIEDCLKVVRDILERGGLGDTLTRAPEGGASAGLPPRASVRGVIAEPRNRAEAIRMLLLVSQFLRRTEPHNPAGLLVQKAVRWSQLPLAKWLEEVLKDESEVCRVFETLGVQRTNNTG
jgi:type VI secretion system protein ImpA